MFWNINSLYVATVERSQEMAEKSLCFVCFSHQLTQVTVNALSA